MRKQRSGAAADITIAIPKGRVLKSLAKRFSACGIDPKTLLEEDRRLVREDSRSGVRFLLLKPDDVPTYVEYGAADLGVVGRDVLIEREYDLYTPLDLGIGVCRMAVAGLTGSAETTLHASDARARALRVATKFPNAAARHFLRKGRQVEVIYVQGSVELAPITGLSDVIVDLVETGETLKQNGLEEFETVCEISSVIVANRVGMKLKQQAIKPLLDALRSLGS